MADHDSIEDRRAVFAERLDVDGTDPARRRILLDGEEVGRVLFLEGEHLEAGIAWVVNFWTGSDWRRSPIELLAQRGDVEEADRHGVEVLATLLAEDDAKPRVS